MLREKLRNKKGFTLIEIIVVIVILAVLMAVAVPSVMSYMNEGQKAKYEAVARTVLINSQTEYAKAVADGQTANAATTTAQNAVAKKSYGDNASVSNVQITLTTKGDKDSEKDIASVKCDITIEKKKKTGVEITTNKNVTVPDESTDAS